MKIKGGVYLIFVHFTGLYKLVSYWCHCQHLRIVTLL